MGFSSVVYREMKLYAFSKLNIVLSLSAPLIYSLLFASSLAGTISEVDFRGTLVSYPEFVVPGLVVLTTLLSAMTSSQSVFQERDSGMLLEILSCPIHPNVYVAGKIFGTAVVSSVQGVGLLLATVLFFRLDWSPMALLRGTLLIPLFSLTFNAMYLCMCGLARNIQTFILSMNVVTMILMFSGTVFYPIASVPTWLRLFATVNPVTLSCETARAAFLGLSMSTSLIILLAVMFLITLCAMIILRRNVLT
ncbi:MAG TPA: hypothetical protein DHW14_08775, partial [Clostridiales bacterium]|nr:hypothetical protein [Clostridiales bacterium]